MDMENIKKAGVYDVFTPTRPARLTFIEREQINERLVDAIRTPGKQLVIFGHSGSGKTTLLVNKLHQIYEDHVVTRCMSGLSFENLILDAFDQLNQYYVSEKTQSNNQKIKASIQNEYLGIKSKLEGEHSKTTGDVLAPILPPQLTPQRLAMFMGEARCCWVLEDFHKIAESEKGHLGQVMKVFMDMADDYPDLKTIAIGAVGTAREVVAYEPEMKNRVTEISVPLMMNEEIREILKKGTKLLNFKISDRVEKDIIYYSNGLASVCHQLALNLCISSNINETLAEEEILSAEAFAKAINRYIEDESDSIKSRFDKALKQKRAGKYDNCRIILTAMANHGKESVSRPEILKIIRRTHKTYPPGNLTNYLKELQSSERGEIINYDENSWHYSFSNPFLKVFSKALFTQDRLKLSEMTELFVTSSLNSRTLSSTIKILSKVISGFVP